MSSDSLVLITGAGPTGLVLAFWLTRLGLKRGALYLIRPDGYIALADPEPDAERLRQYFAAHPRSSRWHALPTDHVSGRTAPSAVRIPLSESDLVVSDNSTT